ERLYYSTHQFSTAKLKFFMKRLDFLQAAVPRRSSLGGITELTACHPRFEYKATMAYGTWSILYYGTIEIYFTPRSNLHIILIYQKLIEVAWFAVRPPRCSLWKIQSAKSAGSAPKKPELQ